MKIGLLPVDSKIPNLALMKISTYYKNLGNEVERYFSLANSTYDKIYASKQFDFSSFNENIDGRWLLGGTGFSLNSHLSSRNF